MKILLPIFLFAFCTAVLSQNQPSPTGEANVSDHAEIITEADAISNETTTTTTIPTTASTSTEETTTPVPTTPTPVPTTPTPVPTTPTPTPSPAPTTKLPEPDECPFNVTCIQAKLKAEFIIPIEGKEYTVNLGCNLTKEYGDCSSNETQTLSLVEDNYYNLTLVFEKEDNSVFIRNVSFTYNLPEGKGSVANNSGNLLKVKAGNSYLCKSKFDIQMDNVTMKISFIRVQAFLEKEEFGKAEECEADDKVSDIVPIAVGVALAALIIVVLIAYLVGRRRSRQKGYQSV